MASTQKRQEEARNRRRAEALHERMQKRFLPNTTTWVDDDYARRLAEQLNQEIDKLPPGFMTHLDRVRKSIAYITEEETRRGTLVYVWDRSILEPTRGWVMLTSVTYRNGKAVKLSDNVAIIVSPHALARMYLRLRTNSNADLLRLAKSLLVLGTPTLEQALEHIEVEVSVAGGVAYFVAESVAAPHPELPDLRTPPSWIMKTFIADKK